MTIKKENVFCKNCNCYYSIVELCYTPTDRLHHIHGRVIHKRHNPKIKNYGLDCSDYVRKNRFLIPICVAILASGIIAALWAIGINASAR